MSFIVSRQWPRKKIGGRWYSRLLTYPTVEAAKAAQQPGQRRIKTTLYEVDNVKCSLSLPPVLAAQIDEILERD